jgi:hypothetical protein
MKSKLWLPYVAPMAIYMAFLFVQSPENLLWMYPVKTLAVAAALWWFRKEYEELYAHRHTDAPTPYPSEEGNKSVRLPSFGGAGGGFLLAVIVGLVAIAIWIALDPFYPKMSASQPFDPTQLESSTKWTFIGFRILGAVIVVPLMEELFWRAFLIRWLVDADFKRVPVGTFTWLSFAITVALFGAEHNEWLAGLICGALYNWLYYRRKDVFACVVAHAVSNAALAAWVLARGDWKFW